jgi:hypothetical protein
MFGKKNTVAYVQVARREIASNTFGSLHFSPTVVLLYVPLVCILVCECVCVCVCVCVWERERERERETEKEGEWECAWMHACV